MRGGVIKIHKNKDDCDGNKGDNDEISGRSELVGRELKSKLKKLL